MTFQYIVFGLSLVAFIIAGISLWLTIKWNMEEYKRDFPDDLSR